MARQVKSGAGAIHPRPPSQPATSDTRVRSRYAICSGRIPLKSVKYRRAVYPMARDDRAAITSGQRVLMTAHEQPARAGQVSRQRPERRDCRVEHSDRHSARVRARRQPSTDPALLPGRSRGGRARGGQRRGAICGQESLKSLVAESLNTGSRFKDFRISDWNWFHNPCQARVLSANSPHTWCRAEKRLHGRRPCAPGGAPRSRHPRSG